MIGTFTNSVANLVTQATTTQAIWDTLQKTYATASHRHKQQIKHKIENVKKYNSSILDYMNTMKTSGDLLASLQAPISQEDLTNYILKELDSSYQSIIDGVNVRETPISFEELHETLIITEMDLKQSSSSDGAPVMALNAQTKNGKKHKAPASLMH